MRTVGVIGTGNMGSALVKGWLRPPDPRVRVLVWDKMEDAARRLLGSGPVQLAGSLAQLVAEADVVVVVVKPKDAKEVLEGLADLLHNNQAVVSSMAGLTLEWIRGVLGPGPSLFRIMPNLGVELGVGAIALAHEPDVPAAETRAVLDLLAPLGLVETLPERLFDAVTGVSGSGPAFLAVAVEGLEDGAVAAGLSRVLARSLVRQTVLATAAQLSLHSDSPAELRAHPATIEDRGSLGMETLEERGVRSAFQKAVEAAVERSRQMRSR